MTVLPSLGSGHVNNLAGTALDDNEAALSQGGTLHGVGKGGACIGRVEGVPAHAIIQSATLPKEGANVVVVHTRIRGTHARLTWASLGSAMMMGRMELAARL